MKMPAVMATDNTNKKGERKMVIKSLLRWFFGKIYYYDHCESRFKLIFLKPFQKDKIIREFGDFDITTWEGSWGEIDWKKDSEKKILQTITYFYRVGVDFNMERYGKTPLMYAAMDSSLKVVDFLVDGGADPSIEGEKGWTALHYAASEGNVENINWLIEKGARNVVNKKDSSGETPLHIAARRGYTQSVNALIENGAEINVLNETGNTALHIAALWGHLETVKALLTLGADAFIKNKENKTAWSFARTEKIRNVILDSVKIRNDYLKKNPVKVLANSSNKKKEAFLQMLHQYE